MENEEIVLNLAGISELFCRFLKQFSVVIFFYKSIGFYQHDPIYMNIFNLRNIRETFFIK